MCDICWRNPCDPRCPNAPDPRAVFVCSGCGHNILDGDRVWHILGEQFCERCVDRAEEVAEYDPY